MKKLLDEQTSKMIKDTAKPPADRLKTVKSFLASSNFPNDEVMKQFKITMPQNPKLHSMMGRLIQPPELCYRDSANVSVPLHYNLILSFNYFVLSV